MPEAVYFSLVPLCCNILLALHENNISWNSHLWHSFSSYPLLPKLPQCSLGQTFLIHVAHSLHGSGGHWVSAYSSEERSTVNRFMKRWADLPLA